MVCHSDISVPKLTVCSNSLHSLEKLRTKYPDITIDVLEEFYGRSAVQLMESKHQHYIGGNISVSFTITTEWLITQHSISRLTTFCCCILKQLLKQKSHQSKNLMLSNEPRGTNFTS